MSKIDVSVVMGIYNEARHLDDTIQSILSQQGVALELVIVNDGSSDNSENVIRSYMAKDQRVVLINQENQGLTQALINGCNQVRGDYIARQDAGDLSLQGRLERQLDALKTYPDITLISAGTAFFGPEKEEIYRTIQSKREAATCLVPENVEHIYGPPHHGSTMFRRSEYKQVGGYRKEFRVAQDLDLWTRLVELGRHHSLDSIYYRAGLYPASISSSKRSEQMEAKELIIDLTRLRRQGGDDTKLLKRASKKLSYLRTPSKPSNIQSRYYYFLASNLSSSNKKNAQRYYKKAIRANPLNFKAWIKIALLLIAR